MESSAPITAADPVFGIRSSFRVEGDHVVVDTWIDPGGGVTPHIHPAMEERFIVVEGRAQFLGGREWAESAPGDEEVVVPPGTRHAFRNRSEAEAHIRCEASPPSTLQQFLEDAAALSRAGAINKRGLPTGFDALLRAAVLIEENREMVTMCSPPPFLQRLVMPPLARMGRGRGYRAGALATAG